MPVNQPTCWIETIEPEEAGPQLDKIYQKLKAANNKIHNLYIAASLQPKPILSSDQYYRDILLNESNHLDHWFLELLATQVAIAVDCEYAIAHHGENFMTLLGDDKLANAMIEALRSEDFSDAALFSEKHSALLAFGAKLTHSPQGMCHDDIVKLRDAGASDTEILEAVQTTASFAYWVRYINALGISLGDEKIGMYR